MQVLSNPSQNTSFHSCLWCHKIQAAFLNKNLEAYIFINPNIAQESEISNTVILTLGKWTSLIFLAIYHVKKHGR